MLYPVPRRCLPFRVKCKLLNMACVLGCLTMLLTLSLLYSHLRVPERFNSGPQATLSLQPLNSSVIHHGYKTHCKFHKCFNVNHCALSLREDILGVYVGGPYHFHSPLNSHTLTPGMSREYAELVQAVRSSRYHVASPSAACVFIPPLDTLSQEHLQVGVFSLLLNSLPE